MSAPLWSTTLYQCLLVGAPSNPHKQDIPEVLCASQNRLLIATPTDGLPASGIRAHLLDVGDLGWKAMPNSHVDAAIVRVFWGHTVLALVGSLAASGQVWDVSGVLHSLWPERSSGCWLYNENRFEATGSASYTCLKAYRCNRAGLEHTDFSRCTCDNRRSLAVVQKACVHPPCHRTLVGCFGDYFVREFLHAVLSPISPGRSLTSNNAWRALIMCEHIYMCSPLDSVHKKRSIGFPGTETTDL